MGACDQRFLGGSKVRIFKGMSLWLKATRLLWRSEFGRVLTSLELYAWRWRGLRRKSWRGGANEGEDYGDN